MKKHNLICAAVLALFVLASQIGAQEVARTSTSSIIKATLERFGINAAEMKFREIRTLAEDYAVREPDLLRLGDSLRSEGKTPEAIAVFKMVIEAFPNSDQAYLELGRTYRSLGFRYEDLECTNRAFDIRNARMLTDFIANNKDSLAKNAETVIDRYLQTIGGKETLLEIKTIQLTMTHLNSINQEPSLLRYYKYPHFYRQTRIGAGSSITTDGERVWKVTSEGWEENPQSNFRYAPDIYGDFVGYENKGISYKLLGIEALDSQVFYHLLKVHSDGHTRDYYFSAESGLLVMERRNFGIGKDIKRYYDWRDVKGILFPHLFVVTSEVGLGHSHGAIVKEIKVNERLDDTLFIDQ